MAHLPLAGVIEQEEGFVPKALPLVSRAFTSVILMTPLHVFLNCPLREQAGALFSVFCVKMKMVCFYCS
jgi:hypothetical protein